MKGFSLIPRQRNLPTGRGIRKVPLSWAQLPLWTDTEWFLYDRTRDAPSHHLAATRPGNAQPARPPG